MHSNFQHFLEEDVNILAHKEFNHNEVSISWKPFLATKSKSKKIYGRNNARRRNPRNNIVKVEAETEDSTEKFTDL